MAFAVVVMAAASATVASADDRQFWNIDKGGHSITWEVTPSEAHADHVEMSGKRLSTVLRYGVDSEGRLQLERSLVWPMLRTVPNDTHASLMRRFSSDPLADMKINGKPVKERVGSFTLDGTLTVNSTIEGAKGASMHATHIIFPSTEAPSLIEIYELSNAGDKPVNLELPDKKSDFYTDPAKGVGGSYLISTETAGGGNHTLAPGEKVRFCAITTGSAKDMAPVEVADVDAELAHRRALVSQLGSNLVLETPDPVLNTMFDFAKVRACESIYQTKGGPMHGPGGESYYAAIWANDQAEYANPFFPYVGYGYANQSALNSFRLFAGYMNDEYRPIPSSIIAEGDSYWNGAGDRGDAAMIAYGASRYALARADKKEARELWPLITWCLEYCRRNLNESGVVKSDHDELEGRFPAGEANLCTSSLYYDALISAAALAGELGEGKKVGANYLRQASELKKSIAGYFEANVEGFDTYRYYDGNDVLRSWICIPLTVGIADRARGTIDALFSPRLWTENGMLTQAGTETFWDRSTLYALRGAYAVGERGLTTDFLKKYSNKRLLGDHVPYAVEAWPEGNQRHLSAESALYARIYTEGLFGIRPRGFSSFTLRPQLPDGWDKMNLRHVRAFGGDFDVEVTRHGDSKVHVRVTDGGRVVADRSIPNGAEMLCRL